MRFYHYVNVSVLIKFEKYCKFSISIILFSTPDFPYFYYIFLYGDVSVMCAFLLSPIHVVITPPVGKCAPLEENASF